MRRILIVSVLLIPMLFTAMARASNPGTDAVVPTPDIRVSTGVVAPKILYRTSVDALPSDLMIPHNTAVVLSFHVDEKGQASDFQVVNPTNPILEDHVINAVSKFRFAPATLDNLPVPIDMTWTVEVDGNN